jgi:hypothetical protein
MHRRVNGGLPLSESLQSLLPETNYRRLVVSANAPPAQTRAVSGALRVSTALRPILTHSCGLPNRTLI